MSNIGLRLFQQLKGIDPEVSRDDYFDEEQHSWDVEGLEEDLKVAHDRLQQTGSTSIPNANININTDDNTIQLQPLLPSLTDTNPNPNSNQININTNNTDSYIQSLPPINTIPIRTTTTITNISTNHNTMINQAMATAAAATVVTSAPIPSNMIMNNNIMDDRINHINGMDEDIDIQTTDTNPAQMPSPNASPSIEYDTNEKEIENDNDNHPHIMTHSSMIHNTNIHHNNINVMDNSHSRKRKNENDMSPMVKKQKLNNNNKWNDLALKKLYSLKRQVKNSGWFWEPVDELKHSAPNYYLVCPLPSDYGTICDKLEKREYNTLDQLLRDCELVFINARLYNTSVHAVHQASMSLEKKFKELMNTFVVQHSKEYGSDKTLDYWINAKKNYKPFAVPIDEE